MHASLLANGRSIAYHSSGPDSSDLPLVLLHGFCEDASIWEPVLLSLNIPRVVRIDLPGFGDSDLPLIAGMEVYADAVCAVLNELGIGRCVLAGHSMGGYTALEFARHYPERLAGFSLIHSHPYEDSPERIESRRRGIEMLQGGKKDLYVAQLFPGLFAPAFAAAHPDVVAQVIKNGRRQATEGIIAALQGMIDRANHLETLRNSACPVQFILGEQDAIIPPGQALAAAALPELADIRLLPEVGHMGMFEASAETAQAIREFWMLCTLRQNAEDANKTQTTN